MYKLFCGNAMMPILRMVYGALPRDSTPRYPKHPYSFTNACFLAPASTLSRSVTKKILDPFMVKSGEWKKQKKRRIRVRCEAYHPVCGAPSRPGLNLIRQYTTARRPDGRFSCQRAPIADRIINSAVPVQGLLLPRTSHPCLGSGCYHRQYSFRVPHAGTGQAPGWLFKS